MPIPPPTRETGPSGTSHPLPVAFLYTRPSPAPWNTTTYCPVVGSAVIATPLPGLSRYGYCTLLPNASTVHRWSSLPCTATSQALPRPGPSPAAIAGLVPAASDSPPPARCPPPSPTPASNCCTHNFPPAAANASSNTPFPFAVTDGLVPASICPAVRTASPCGPTRVQSRPVTACTSPSHGPVRGPVSSPAIDGLLPGGTVPAVNPSTWRRPPLGSAIQYERSADTNVDSHPLPAGPPALP